MYQAQQSGRVCGASFGNSTSSSATSWKEEKVSYEFQYRKDPKVRLATKADLARWGSTRPGAWYDGETGLIYLTKGNSPWHKEIYYFHERAHRKCHRKGCFCWKRNTDFWAEYHAFWGEYRSIKEANHPKLWEAWFSQIENLITYRYYYAKCWQTHRKAKIKFCKCKEIVTVLQVAGLLTRLWSSLGIQP